MKINFKDLFHKISYLSYPLLAIAMFFVFRPYTNGFESIWEDYNSVLIFLGLGISFSTMQDTTKTQNKLSKRVWENPKWGRIFLIYLTIMCIFLISVGLFGYFGSTDSVIKDLSIGIIVLGIGMTGLLKAAGEMRENHRIDKRAN